MSKFYKCPKCGYMMDRNARCGNCGSLLIDLTEAKRGAPFYVRVPGAEEGSAIQAKVILAKIDMLEDRYGFDECLDLTRVSLTEKVNVAKKLVLEFNIQ